MLTFHRPFVLAVAFAFVLTACGAKGTSAPPTSSAATSYPAPPTEVIAPPTSYPAPPTEPILPPTSYPAPTSAGPYTLALTAAQINDLLSSALTAAPANFVSSAGVSLQNGQISQTATFTGANGANVDGQIVLTVEAKDGALRATVVTATVGQSAMADAAKAAIGPAFEDALAVVLATAHPYTSIDSITIADGAMTVVFH